MGLVAAAGALATGALAAAAGVLDRGARAAGAFTAPDGFIAGAFTAGALMAPVVLVIVGGVGLATGLVVRVVG